MRRETVISAVERILNDLQSTGVDAMFEEALERHRQPNSKDEHSFVSFSVFQKYSVATASYGEAEHQILKILDLEMLPLPETWQRMSTDPDRGVLFHMSRAIHFAKNDLPKIVHLFRQEHVHEAKTGGKLPVELEGRTAITFILPEDRTEYSTPSRLIAALESITSIYSAFCTLENQSETDLIVLACDSGSDKSFDFLGLAKIMEEVRKFVISIWDRRVFYRHMHASQCIALIAESLPVIEKIEDLKRKQAIGPEQAELLKRKTLEGATMFLESGIYIEEMALESNHSPRQLMRAEPRLLAAPTPLNTPPTGAAHSPASSTPKADASNTTSLSAEESAVLQHLLSKARGETAPDDPQPRKPTIRRKRTT